MVDDLENKNENTAPLEESDDTKTRKTVRLRPTSTPAGINLTPMPKVPLTDPLSGRDTDTGNLEVMEDTQTRRTVKLRPISPQTGVPTRPLPASGEAKPAGDGSNTQTRKTIVLKPTAVAPAVKIESPTGAAPESDDTKTRKTVRLRPSTVAPPHLLGVPDITAGAPVVTPVAEETETDLESSDTIKIARPPRPGGMIPPRPVMMPGQVPEVTKKPSHSLPVAKPLPSQTPLPGVGGETQTSGVPRVPSVPSADVPPAAPKKAADDDEIALKPTGSSNTETGSTADDSAPTTPAGTISPLAGMQPLNMGKTGGSKFYLALAVACLLLVGGTLTLTLVQYLNLCQQQQIVLPLLSQPK